MSEEDIKEEASDEKSIEEDENVEDEIIEEERVSDFFDEGLDFFDEEINDFSIKDDVLSPDSIEESRKIYDLENLAREKSVEGFGWGDSKSFDEKDSSGNNFYVGSAISARNFYNENKNNFYDSESGKKIERGLYDNRSQDEGEIYSNRVDNTKSYGEFLDSRRSGRSMLEITGFEDREKETQRDIRGLVKYKSDN